MAATAQVIPFQFDVHEVRTLLIDDQPWFVASDVAAALQYRMASDMTRHLDDDEKGTQIVSTLSGKGTQNPRTPSGEQEMTVINESGLYSAILRSRKPEAKRFKKWVTAEVLPAIRKHGSYNIASATIGTDGLRILHELIGKKIKVLPTGVQRQARSKLWSVIHTRFNVPKAELIPIDELANACNFVAAYALEGEWLPHDDTVLATDEADRQNLYALCCHVTELQNLYRHYRLYDALGMLGSPAGKSMYGHIMDGANIAKRYLPRLQTPDHRPMH